MYINKCQINGYKIDGRHYCSDCVSDSEIEKRKITLKDIYAPGTVSQERCGRNMMIFCDRCKKIMLRKA